MIICPLTGSKTAECECREEGPASVHTWAFRSTLEPRTANIRHSNRFMVIQSCEEGGIEVAQFSLAEGRGGVKMKELAYLWLAYAGDAAGEMPGSFASLRMTECWDGALTRRKLGLERFYL